MKHGWMRVTLISPCAVCGKGDWCTVSLETGAACCMRVESARPARNGGWLHGGTGPAERPARARPAAPPPWAGCAPPTDETARTGTMCSAAYEAPEFNAMLWWQTVRHVVTCDRMEVWAGRLGIPFGALDVMGACVLGEMLAFPMYDGHGQVCGIRTRKPDGSKRAVTGSRAGVFLPTFHDGAEPVVCEGPTDAAAALEMGYYPIGRPSCAGCERHVVDTCRRLEIERVTVCADADGPGIAGARRLADVLRAARVLVRLVTPHGHKDLRDWFKAGATRVMVDLAWYQAEWK